VEEPSKQWYVTGGGGCIPGPRCMGIYACGEQQFPTGHVCRKMRGTAGDSWGLLGAAEKL